ncbi:UvrD-helicase domain-containing protein [Piscinibacter gummiphilus]|uniref:DNA 3'-5' helicase n=1 Tax=Piscinibacter gummiphilus TaxID=946333 RepID=A0ABZ0D230_9BURK|nr:UvrD-helicase domain-containing protein [Piscinibacter gummiphilus]WOB11253.1 AAA family ATPase [Piscinibacter gummiphilus]
MKYTDEQMAVIESRANRLTVQAGAGATKTTTLVGYAAARPKARILYLAFNKPVQLEAAARMPKHNVECKTTHSVSFRKALQLFTDRRTGRDVISQKLGDNYPSAIARLFGCPPLMATAALQAIQRWFGSLENDIDVRHVPPELAIRLGDPHAVVSLAREVFAQMVDPRALQVKLPHDGYLKLFQLDRPRLGTFTHIAVDESQDLNLCTFDIVRNQAANLILVGDSNQSIYQYRGSANALDLLSGATRLNLTRSFRFGEGIASLANTLLGHFKYPTPPLLIGAGEPRQTRFSIDVNKPFAVLARSNAGLFNEAVAFLKTGRRYHFIGGVDGYRLDKVLDAYYLWVNEPGLIKDPYLRSFNGFDDLEALAEESDDAELKLLIRVVADYGHQIPQLVDEIRARHVSDLRKEDWHLFEGIFFSTAHKSKGLEFDQVWLADDFMRFFDNGREIEIEEVDQEAVNILYVAFTRARAAIRLCESFVEWLRFKGWMPV